MFDPEYLTLRLVHLKAPDEWASQRAGLSFLFCKGGFGKYASGEAAFAVSPGDVLAISGNPEGRFSVVNRGEAVFWWVSALLEHLFPLLASHEISLLQAVGDAFRSVRLYRAATPLAQECHKLLDSVPPQSDLGHRGQALRIIATILSEEFKAAHGQRVGFIRPEEHMIQVFEKLSVTEILDLSVVDLAGRFGCSRRHLNRLFHQYFGFSVAALRMEMRLLKAVSLLRDPDAKIINIAEECGFNHLGLFNTCFKRRFGASPGQYRKLNLPAVAQHSSTSGESQTCPLHMNGLCPWTGGSPVAPPPAAVQPVDRKPRPARSLRKPGASNPAPASQTAATQPPLRGSAGRQSKDRPVI